MYLHIITPEKTVLEEEIEKILVPTNKGQIGILPHHINLITNLSQGEMIIESKGKKNRSIAITGGFIEVAENKITVLADYAEHVEKIDIQKAKDAKQRAEEVLSNKKSLGISDRDLLNAQAELRRSLLQLHIAEKHRSKSS